jgi:hypothetical protein
VTAHAGAGSIARDFRKSLRLLFAKNGFSDGLRAQVERGEMMLRFNDIGMTDEARRGGEVSVYGIRTFLQFFIFTRGGSRTG